MEGLPKPFEIHVGDRDLSLTLGMCAVALFRKKQEVSYIAVDTEDEGESATLRIFNNPDIAFDMAGYTLAEREGELYRPTARRDWGNGFAQTFREVHGWNPAVIEREEPNEAEIDMWVDINMQDLDGGNG
jgi:hypothetical protein